MTGGRREYGLVALEVQDDEVWDRIQNGRLAGFSVAQEEADERA